MFLFPLKNVAHKGLIVDFSALILYRDILFFCKKITSDINCYSIFLHDIQHKFDMICIIQIYDFKLQEKLGIS